MGQLAVAKHLQSVVKVTHDAPLHKQFRRDDRAGLEAFAEIPNVNNRVFLLKSIGKAAAPWEAPVQRRLAALKSRPHGVPRVLTLASAAGRLAMAAADSPPDSLSRLHAAGGGSQLSES